MNEIDFIQVQTTVDSEKEARKIAEFLVGENLVACVKIISGVESHYRWDGKVENSKEFLLLIASTKGRYLEIESRIKQIHSYDLPEIICLDINSGSKEYLNWINASTK